MELEYFNRSGDKKSSTKRLRREGKIPAVIYCKGSKGTNICINALQLNSVMRGIKAGFLPTTIFILKDESGARKKAIIKDIQYALTTYDVIHLDFEELIEAEKINVKVPIQCLGTADCLGVKAGGVLRQVIRHMKVRCLPKDIPSHLDLDVKDLGMRQGKRLKDIALPSVVCPIANLNEVVVTIVKR